MIKTFISHSSNDDSFVNRLEEKLKRENIGLDIFVDHYRNKTGDSPQSMINQVETSIIFIPIMTKESLSKDFINNEIKTALVTDTVNIFPINREAPDIDIPPGLKIEFKKYDDVGGILWSDFSNEKEWEIKYQELKEAIFNRLIELDLLRKDDKFYQDVEIIDLILKRQEPTPAEIKIIIDVYLKKESYWNYFFEHVENIEWFSYLHHYGFFRHNPEPIENEEQVGSYTIPYWRSLIYIEKISNEIVEEKNTQYGDIIMEIIRYHSKLDECEKRVENYLTDWHFIKIMSKLPPKNITIDDIKNISNYLDVDGNKTLIESEIGKSLLPNLIKAGEKEKVAGLLEIIIKNKWRNQEPISIIEEYWLNELIEKNKSEICNLLPFEAAKVFVNQIFLIISHDRKQFNNVWIAAIEDHSQNSFPDRYQNILVRATRDFILHAVNEDAENIKEFIIELLEKEHSIFKRIAIYIISTNWDNYSILFWEYFGEEIFDDISIKHEIYELFNNNFELLTEEQKDRVIDWIENCPYWLPDEYQPEEKQMLLAITKQNWLHAIKDSKFQKAKERYEYYKDITNTEPEHPSFSCWMGEGGVQVGAISPIKFDELLERSNQDISQYLIEYKDTGEWFGMPSIGGLEDTLREAAKRNPDKFSSDLSPFLEVSQVYQYKLLFGFFEAWQNNKEFDWNSVLEFCQQIINDDGFWSYDYHENELNHRDLIISQIAFLLREGTRDDSHAYDEKYLPVTEEIVLKILSNVESDIKYKDDLSMSIANSPKGLILTAAIDYSLRYARLNKDSDEVRWPKIIKEEFTNRLNKTFDDSLEFPFILGMYFQNLLYLDKNWVEENINLIFPLEYEEQWKAAMQGYLLHSKVYDSSYSLIKKNGHYLSAINAEFGKKEIREKIIQHICTGYLIGKENLTENDSLLFILLEDWNSKDILEMISYFWMLRRTEELSDEHVEKILLFWNFIFKHYKNKIELYDDDKIILASIAKLAVFLDRIDERNFELLKLSVKFLSNNFSSFFIEYLDKLVDNSPNEAGLVYLEILENDIYPDYDEKHIKSIVYKLYNNHQKDIADEICNLYGSKGLNFLRDIFDENN